MKAKNETDTLNEMIIDLERKRSMELILLKEQFHTTVDSFKLSNLLKNTFQELTSSPGVKSNLLSNAIGIGTGLLSKKLFIGGSNNPLKKLLGTVAQFAITNVISKHSDGIKSTGGNLFQRLFKSRKEDKNTLKVIDSPSMITPDVL